MVERIIKMDCQTNPPAGAYVCNVVVKGIPLATIGDAFGVLPEGHNLSAKEWKMLSSQWREELDRRIHTLTALRDQLDGCIGCGCLSRRDCPLRNPGDKLGEEGTGARLLEDE